MIKIIVFAVVQVIIIILYATCTHYNSDFRWECKVNKDAKHCVQKKINPDYADEDLADYIQNTAPLYGSLIGFGLLYCFFKDHALTSVTMILFAACFAIEWGYLTLEFFALCFYDKGYYADPDSGEPKKAKRFNDIKIHGRYYDSSGVMEADDSLTNAYPIAAVVIISYGAVAGRVNLAQLLIMTFIEAIFYSLNYCLCMMDNILRVSDIGGSITFHTFAAFFGMGCAFILNKDKGEKTSKPNSHTGAASILGAIIIWLYFRGGINWNGENGDSAAGVFNTNTQKRYSFNMDFAIIGHIFAMFLVPLFFNKGKIKADEIIYSTVSAIAFHGDYIGWIQYPILSFCLGLISGAICACVYHFVKPILTNALKYYDSMGVLYWHGIPAFLGVLTTTIFIGCMTGKDWNYPLSKLNFANIFLPQMEGYEKWKEEDGMPFQELKGVRKHGQQAGWEFLAEIVTMIIGLVGGVASGFVMNLGLWGKAEKEFSDDIMFDQSS